MSPASRSLNLDCTVSSAPSRKLRLNFVDDQAGVTRLSERLYGLKVQDEGGSALPVEILGDGRYAVNTPDRVRSLRVTYQVRLGRVLDPSQYALTSSLGPEAGLLMLSDLLPRWCHDQAPACQPNPVRISIAVPDGWRIAPSDRTAQDGVFEFADPKTAVCLIGKLRERTVIVGAINLRVAIAGVWSFTDQEVYQLAEAIAREQALIVGRAEASDYLVTLAPFPLPLTGLRSSGVAIGGTAVLLLNPDRDPGLTLAHYRRHLAHEMFHFYLPNSLRIRENFDWFWEGFTRYTALLTLARLRLIGIREYLDAIGEEYQAYAFNPLRGRVSLIEASPEKFANSASYDLVYRKGMLVAALYDLELRWRSRGRSNVAELMRNLYRKYGLGSLEIGNREILDELILFGNFSRPIRDDVENTREIDLIERVKPYGLIVELGPATRGRVRLIKAPKLSERQSSLFSQIAGE